MRRAGPFSAMLSPLSAPSSGAVEEGRCRLVSIRNAGRPKKRREVGGRGREGGRVPRLKKATMVGRKAERCGDGGGGVHALTQDGIDKNEAKE